MRYAVYYAPKPGSPLWRAGCQWLGSDAASGKALTQPEIDGIDAGVLAALTRDAARYGWHATLKAPFPLRIDVQAGTLLRHVAELAAAFRPFALNLQVDWLDSFLALRPAEAAPELDELAAACAVALEPLADRGAPLKPRAGLDPRQQTLYRRWGYPYVFEQFRFHMTLSDTLPKESPQAKALEQGARRHFAGVLNALAVDGIAVFVEREQGGPFHYLAYCGFDGEVTRYGD